MMAIKRLIFIILFFIFAATAYSSLDGIELNYANTRLLIDTAVLSENMDLLRYASRNPNFEFYFDHHHVSMLVNSDTEVSYEMLYFVVNLSCSFALDYIQTDLVFLLLRCIPNKFDKFALFWSDCDCEELDAHDLSLVIYGIAYHNATEFMDYISRRYFNEENFSLAINAVIDFTEVIGEARVLDFLEHYDFEQAYDPIT